MAEQEERGPAGADDAAATAGRSRGLCRRRLVAGAGIAGALGIAGFGGGVAGRALAEREAAGRDPGTLAYPFRGETQQGITTPAQDNMYTAAFDVSTDDVAELKALLTEWTTAAEQMCAGELIGGEPSANKQAPPRDTGEAWGYPPAGLSLTFGFGATLFADAGGADRFGLRDRMPGVLAEGVPKFANERLQAGSGDGDLLVQACSNDPQVCVHAIRNLTRIAFGTARLRWGQIGYGRTSSTSASQETPRNLFGFKDGTANVKAEEAEALEEHVRVQADDDAAAGWLTGGSYFVARKIRMHLEVWDRVRLAQQEEVIGRDKRYGAPLSVADPAPEDEFDAVDYDAAGEGGRPAVPADSHVAVVSPEQNDGHRLLRRGYNYTDGNDSLGRLDAGLFFIAYVRDPRAGFYPILQRMTQHDALTEYLQHEASALFAVPPGLREGDTMVGQRLFE
ncbi:iron uptake transporter deferrochelatase/peroxidase subunit [Rothia sp. AR01]|uniref:Deferrochelatase n=1 Tax=Rothia santali TaxID=2949643 RepID=A0A9X2HKB3_9MICC|nr:iron uptake transporter deferrochelatase/peroxidase subunit [Rothia santali]MCP3427306.1 iron uptake transporter deferrochelatase/peroxidase subunit [Rothia santali]